MNKLIVLFTILAFVDARPSWWPKKIDHSYDVPEPIKTSKEEKCT